MNQPIVNPRSLKPEHSDRRMNAVNNRYSFRGLQRIDDSYLLERADGSATYGVKQYGVGYPNPQASHGLINVTLTKAQHQKAKKAVRFKPSRFNHYMEHRWNEGEKGKPTYITHVYRPHQSDIWKLNDLIEDMGLISWQKVNA